MDEKKIAICFWGLVKSLDYTLESIEENIFKILKDANIKYDIYIHTYKINGEYNNIYSKEQGLLNYEEYKLLNPTIVAIDDQNKIKENLNLNEYRTHEDPWNNGFKTADNFICALYSKLQVTNIVKNTDIKYTNILFLRPDVKFLNPLDISKLNIKNEFFCIPKFSSHSGFNDRFFLGNYENGIIYGSAFNNLLEYSKNKKIHSETYCQFYMTKINKLKRIDIDIKFNRVRLDGRECIKDSTLP